MPIAFLTWFKPSGVPCFPPHGDPDGDCVLAQIREVHPEQFAHDWPDGFEGGIAHRLDTHTSGALVVARDPASLTELRRRFADHSFEKTYLFLAGREVPWDDNTCDRPLAHDKARSQRMVVQRGPNTPHRGRWYEAETRFERVDGRLWRATIRTGVMHQIRAHAAFVGIPLAGDRVYGGGDAADGGGGFRLHHVGLRGAGLQTAPVPRPAWAGGPATGS